MKIPLTSVSLYAHGELYVGHSILHVISSTFPATLSGYMRVSAAWKRRYPPAIARNSTNPRQHRLTRPVNLPLLKLRIDGLGPPRRGGPFSSATIFLVSQPRPRDCEPVISPPSFLLVRSPSRPDPLHHVVPGCASPPLSVIHAFLLPLRVPSSESSHHVVPRESPEYVRLRVCI